MNEMKTCFVIRGIKGKEDKTAAMEDRTSNR